jgi:UDP-N-acetyl-D-glucosamine dehydrogenase
VDQQSRGILGIVGQGYVGLPLAMAAVDAGWTVYGLDILETKVSEINRGFSPVEDVSNSQLKSALSSGAYLATCDFSLVSKASVVTICVPTPLDEKREPDLKVLRSAVSSIAPYISSDTLVISESTSYPGTLRDVIVPIVNEIKPKNSKNIFYASAPERVNPGDLVWNQGNTPRLVGGINEESQQRAIQFYESICHFVVPVSTPEIAEAAKLLENTFRLVNIALANEFTRICSASGINAHEVIDAASSKPYGFMPFRPGVGVGGHCIPVDPLYLTWWARERGEIATFVEAADSVNQAMPKYVASRAMEMIDRGVKHPRVLILGIAYKSGVGDVRETPVSQLRTHLEALGAEVAWHDPLVKVWAGSKPVDLSWDCDLAILATNQPGMNLRDIIGKGIQILDCTNSFNNQWGIVSL